MTRKRFVKLLMAKGVSRNEAVAEAEWVTSKLKVAATPVTTAFTFSGPIYGQRRSWSYAERFNVIEARVGMNMGVRRLSTAFISAGTTVAAAAGAFDALSSAMASPMYEVAERFVRKEEADGTA